MAFDSSLARNRTVFTTSSSSTSGPLSPIWARLSAVRTVAGATALMRMFASRYSRASSRVRPATADFAALYADICMSGRTTAIEEKLTMEPAPRARSSGTAAWHMKNAVLKLTASSRSSSSGLTSVKGPKLKNPPATFTTISSPPNCACAAATAARATSGCVKSPADDLAAIDSDANSLTRSASPTALTSASSSLAPARPRPRATAWPICPTRPTPVTSATLPRRSAGTDDVVDRRGAALRKPDCAVAADHVHRALNAFAVILQRFVRTGDRALRIGQQREIETKLLDIALVAVDARGVHPERLHLCCFELGDLIAHGGELAVSAGRVVARIEHQCHRSKLQQIGQRVGLPIRRRRLERGGFTADRQRLAHSVSSL